MTLGDKLVERVIKDLQPQDHPDSHIAPLLQYHLTHLWEKAIKDSPNDYSHIHFSEEQYLSIKKDNLQELFKAQLTKLEAFFPKAVTSGLVLDILNEFTSPQLTASSQQDQQLLNAYQNVDGIEDMLMGIKQHTRLLMGIGTLAHPVSKLAHDALAPIIRYAFQESDLAAQRARRIVETKTREKKAGIKPDFSETDINIIEEAIGYMRHIPADIWQIIERNKDTVPTSTK